MTKPIFNFSIPELCQRADKLAISYKRDTESFKAYGYNGESLSNIETQTETLKQYPSDDYYEGKQKQATDVKNQLRATLETNISDLKNRTRLALGTKSMDYSLFKFSKLASLNDNDLVQYSLHVVNIAQPILDKLSSRLVTQEDLDTILSDRSKLDDAIDIQASAISERRIKKVERTKLANELYQLISELSEVGKIIWKEQNEAYYTDYVIYGSAKAIVEQEIEVEEEVD
ncbi:hypothetical protein E9993_01370 [Labilibacter sediminis]|nr:hypothetical protein E9993_01370 [Labilibacter sediminis]